MVVNLACAFRAFHYLPRNRNASQKRPFSASEEMTMILLLLPALASIASWVLDLASRGGRNGLLKMPAPPSLSALDAPLDVHNHDVARPSGIARRRAFSYWRQGFVRLCIRADRQGSNAWEACPSYSVRAIETSSTRRAGCVRAEDGKTLLLVATLELSTTETGCLRRWSAAVPCRHLRIDTDRKRYAIIARR